MTGCLAMADWIFHFRLIINANPFDLLHWFWFEMNQSKRKYTLNMQKLFYIEQKNSHLSSSAICKWLENRNQDKRSMRELKMLAHCTEGWGLLKVAHSSKNLPSPIQLKLLRSVTGTQEHTFQPNLWPFFALKGSKRLQISWARRKSRFFWKIRVFLHFSFFRRKFNFWPNHDNAFVSSCLKQHQMAKNMHFFKNSGFEVNQSLLSLLPHLHIVVHVER